MQTYDASTDVTLQAVQTQAGGTYPLSEQVYGQIAQTGDALTLLLPIVIAVCAIAAFLLAAIFLHLRHSNER